MDENDHTDDDKDDDYDYDIRDNLLQVNLYSRFNLTLDDEQKHLTISWSSSSSTYYKISYDGCKVIVKTKV